MINGDQPSTFRGYPPVPSNGMLEKLQSYRVDDLAKYNVLRFLCSHPEAAGDADYFASNLGFHSVELTESVLAELADAGVLTRTSLGNGAIYRLSNNQTMAGEIQNLCVIATDLPAHGEAFRKLAAGSIRRVKKAKARPAS